MSTAPTNIITSVCGAGPLLALDLMAIPQDALLNIVHAALLAEAHWADGNIEATSESAEDAMNGLSKACTALDELLMPIIPGAPYTSRGDLMCQDSYPIIRNGVVVQVAANDLTPLELEAVRAWLAFHAGIARNHEQAIQERIAAASEVRQ